MTLLLLLVVGGAAAAGTAWSGARGGTAARVGAIGGVVALLLVLVLALASPAPAAGGDGVPSVVEGLFGGSLVPTDYLRLVVSLWALDAILLIGIAWLIGGLPALRGLLPGTLAAITGGAVALGAADLGLGILAAAAAGLASLIVVVAVGRGATVPVAARELRASLGAGALLLGATAVAPVAAALTLGASTGGTGGVASAADASAGEAGAVLGLVSLAITIAVAVRGGSIPFHLRVPRLADVVPPIAMPLLLGWISLPVAVVALGALDRLVAPLALPLEGERGVIIAIALFTMAAGALAAFIQDDLRHGVGYLVIADGGLVLLGFAALDPAAWGPTRTWLVALAASKTALGAWAAVTEARFETRSLPDLRGWIRRAPMLAAGLVLTIVATFGVPGWVVFGARGDLARLAASGPLDTVLILAGFLTLPVYLRILAIGAGPASTPVARAVPERIVRTRRPAETLAVEAEGDEGAASQDSAGPARPASRRSAALTAAVSSVVSASLGRRFAAAIGRDRTELLSAAVLALAVLAALTSWGALNIGGAAAEAAPIVVGPASD